MNTINKNYGVLDECLELNNVFQNNLNNFEMLVHRDYHDELLNQVAQNIRELSNQL